MHIGLQAHRQLYMQLAEGADGEFPGILIQKNRISSQSCRMYACTRVGGSIHSIRALFQELPYKTIKSGRSARDEIHCRGAAEACIPNRGSSQSLGVWRNLLISEEFGSRIYAEVLTSRQVHCTLGTPELWMIDANPEGQPFICFSRLITCSLGRIKSQARLCVFWFP